MKDPVYMSHPKVDGTAGPVERKSLQNHWSAKGWVEAEEATPVVSDADATVFDPSEHTVDEVNAHLASLLEDDPERQRILDIESAGKARSGILNA